GQTGVRKAQIETAQKQDQKHQLADHYQSGEGQDHVQGRVVEAGAVGYPGQDQRQQVGPGSHAEALEPQPLGCPQEFVLALRTHGIHPAVAIGQYCSREQPECLGRQARLSVRGRTANAARALRCGIYCCAFFMTKTRRLMYRCPLMFANSTKGAPHDRDQARRPDTERRRCLQFISYYHPTDFIKAMHEAYLREESPAARDAIAQILINSRMCATGHRPICQDTGIVTVIAKVGMDVRWDGATMSLDDMINEGVRRAYTHPDNVLRASVLADPAGARKNTRDNTPAVIHYQVVPGNTVEIHVAATGGGSEHKSQMAMLHPSDSIVDWVLKTVPTMGAGWCPPGMLGIGIGGTAEKAALMAKEVLMDPIDIHELQARGPQNRIEELRLELFEKVNKLGIGA